MDTGPKGQGTGIVERIWKFFSSIRLAVICFTAISLTSIVGTIVEQQASAERNIRLLGKFFGSEGAPGVYRVVDALGFTDMYHSWWFIGILFIFATNLVVCSVERLPGRWRAAREPIGPLEQGRFAGMPIKREQAIKAKGAAAREAVVEALRKLGFGAAERQTEPGVTQLYGERGRYSRLGVYVTHLSILIIFAGALGGIFFGFSGHLNLQEGTSSAVAYRSNGKEIPLGFEVRCDDFEVEFYAGTDTPKAYRSWLRIVEGGKEVQKQEIEVNKPLRYRGVTFYQASYGLTPNREAQFRFVVTGKDGKKQAVQVPFGGSFTIPGTAVNGTVADFTPALGIDEQGRLFTYAESMNNPAVFVQFSEGGRGKYNQWILKRYPETWQFADGTVEFAGLWGAQYTGLQVRKDPGVWLVYLGCLVMAIGLYAAFFMSHRRVWVVLREDKGGTKVSLAAAATKNRVALEEKIDRMMRELGK